MVGSLSIAAKLSRRLARGKLHVMALALALVATLTIIGGAPAHAIEDLRSPPSAEAAAVSYSPRAEGERTNPHTVPGHVCAAHCACHVLGSPAEPQCVALPLVAETCWAAVRTQSKARSPVFGLRRPPRA